MNLKETVEFLYNKASQLAERERNFQELKTSDGRKFRTWGSTLTEHRVPTYPHLKTSTLKGLVDAIQNESVTSPHFISVVGPTEVRAWGTVEGEWLDRQLYARADAAPSAFVFDNWYSLEDATVAIQVHFDATPERDELLRTLSNLSSGTLRSSVDDGISQTVSVRAGITLQGEKTIVNPITLRPYRTFSDVIQPESPFIVRLRSNEKDLPKVAIFEADGGLWERRAMENIHYFLSTRLACPVIM